MNGQDVLTSVLVACALITTGLVVYREVFSPSGPKSMGSPRPVFVESWRSELKKGRPLGPRGATVQLIEFADFECPYCASLHVTLEKLRERYPRQVSISFVHYPLPGHRYAEEAARAAECAGEQGRFEALHDRLFEQQSAFGQKAWTEFATEARVPDPAAFSLCIQSKTPVPRIVEGRRLGEQLGIKGTPTLIVNGWMLANPPSEAELDGMVEAILEGKSPISRNGKPVQ